VNSFTIPAKVFGKLILLITVCGLWQRAAGSENPEESSGALLEIIYKTKVIIYVFEKHFVEKKSVSGNAIMSYQ
jgi:hypothetical protein